MTMVVRMFETLTDAQRAVSDLVESGYARSTISVLVRDALAHARPVTDNPPEHDPVSTATSIIVGGPLGVELHRNGKPVGEHAVARCLETAGLQLSAAQYFTNAVCHGAILVAVHCRDSEVRYAHDILEVHRAAGSPLPGSTQTH